MGATHKTQLVGFIQAAATGRYYIQEHPELYKVPDQVGYQTVSLRERKSSKELARCRFQTLPGCCGILLLHNFSGLDGAVVQLVEIITRAAKKAKYGLVLFSLRIGHWTGTSLTQFVNPKTNNRIGLYGLETEAEATPDRGLEDR